MNTGSWTCKTGNVLLACSLLFPVTATASINLCSHDFAQLQSRFVYGKSSDTEVENLSGSVGRQRVGLDLIGPLPGDEKKRRSMFGAGHRYTIFDIDDIPSQSNGHVHTFYLPYFQETKAQRGTFRFAVAPALSASSNIIKVRNRWRGATTQLLAGFRFANNDGWRVGACADYRFGEFHLYPAFSRVLRSARWQIELGFPDSTAAFEVNGNSALEVSLGPDGNQWQVANEALTRRSRFGYRAYRLRVSYGWRLRPGFSLTVATERRFAQRLDLLLRNGQRARIDLEDSNAVSMRLAWRFGKPAE